MSLEPEAGRDGGDGEHRPGAPRLDDAQRAAAALGGAGASRVLVYGSVARGDQRPGSDIDLVAIFDDLDYDKRLEVKQDLCERAGEAAGHEVNVHPTDWPEWTMRTQNVSSSFEAHIAADAVTLWDREPREVQWQKPMVKATTNLEEAKEPMISVEHAVHYKLRGRLEAIVDHPSLLMEQPRAAWGDHEIVGMFCRDSTFALWNAVRVMVSLRGGYPPRLLRDLDFAGFVAALPPEVRARCAPWAEEVAKIDVSGYESSCGDRWCCFPVVPGKETVEIARTLAAAAARAAVEALEQIRRRLNDAADGAWWRLTLLEDDAAEVLALLERWDPPIRGVAAPAEPVGAPPECD